MNREALIGLVNNVVLLLALAILYDTIPRKAKVQSRQFKVMTGASLGLIGVAVMLTSWQIRPGIVFDTRSILLSTAGLFFGIIPTALAVIITGLFRLYQGGLGAWTGVFVIVVAAGTGVLWRHWRSRQVNDAFTWQELYAFGLLVHALMLLCMLTLPWDIALDVLRGIALPVLIVFPIGNTLLGLLLARQLERQQLKQQILYQANLLQNVSDAVISTDMNFRILSFNPAAENLYGWRAEEAIGQLLDDLILTEYAEQTTSEQVIAQFLAAGVWRGEVRQTRRDGQALFIFGAVTLLKDSAGMPLGVVAINRDVTGQKQVEAALQASEARFRLLAENARDIIYRYEFTPERHFAYISPAVTAITGYLPEAFYNDVQLVDKLAQTNANLVQVIKERDQGIAQDGPMCVRWLRPDGRGVWIEDHSTPVYDEAGSLIAMEGIARDVTKRVVAERRSNLLLRLTTAVAAATDLNTAWNITLQEVCETAAWAVGEVWLPTATNQYLVSGAPCYCRSNQMQAFCTASKMLQFAPGVGLPGQVWASKEPAWWTDIGERADFGRVALARAANLHGAIAIPVLADHEVVAVMNFLLTTNPSKEDEEMVEVLAAAAAQLGTAVQRKQTEERLRLQSAALNAAANAIAITDIRGVIEWANPAFTTLTGYSENESVGKTMGRLLNSGMQDREFFEELWQTIISGHVWHGEILNRRQDGSLYTEEQTITPLRDEHGAITHFIAIKQDITTRKDMEIDRARLLTQIQRQAEHIQQIIDNVPTGVLMMNGYGQIILANPVAEKQLQILAQYDDYGAILYLGTSALEELLTSLPQSQWHEITSSGHIFEVMVCPVQDDADPERWVVVINEVTEERARQQYQQAQEQLAIVGQLAAGIAHDFNNIMGVIMIYAQILHELPDLSDASYRQLATINSQAQQATDLIGQILDFSRRSIMARVTLDLLPILKELVKLLERTLPESIAIELSYQERAYHIEADPTRIQQALMNLAINARDAMPQGGQLHMELTRLSIRDGQAPPLPDMVNGEWVQLVVRDTGTGIPPQHMPHMFEPFFTTKDRGRGTGLGLAQVYGIVKQHDGSIDVQSQVGVGTAFSIYLPLLDLPETLPTAVSPAPELPSGQETILLVEDDMAMRLSVGQALNQLGYHTLLAETGTEALAVLMRDKEIINLVLSDLVMPGMGGKELYKIMRRDYPDVKIMLTTGHISDSDDDDWLQNEQITWLAKPFNLRELAVTLRSMLDEP